MAAMSCTSNLRRQLPSQMMAAMATGIADEMAAYPDAVPAAIRAKARNWSPPDAAGIHVIGDESRAAGWRRGRLPGLRDPAGAFNPVFDRMMATARSAEGSVSPEREAALKRPQSKAQLWQAAIYRWSAWFGRDCHLKSVYRDEQGRFADSPAYRGQGYDADHAPDELLRQVLDVTLIDWIVLLETLRMTWPRCSTQFGGATRSRSSGCSLEPASAGDELPAGEDEPAEALRAVVAIFWEAERCLRADARRLAALAALPSRSYWQPCTPPLHLAARYRRTVARHDMSRRHGVIAARLLCCSVKGSRSTTMAVIRITRSGRVATSS